MTTIVHQKQTMLPQYERFQTLQTHVLQVMDKNKKMLLTRDMIEKVLTLVIPNRVFVLEMKIEDDLNHVIHTDVVDVETGEIISDSNVFENEASMHMKNWSMINFYYFKENSLVMRCKDRDKNWFEFQLNFSQFPMINKEYFDAYITMKETTVIARTFLLGLKLQPEYTQTTLIMKESASDGITHSDKETALATFSRPPNHPDYFNYLILRNNTILFDVGCCFFLFTLEGAMIRSVHKPNNIPRYKSMMIQLLNGLVLVASGLTIEIEDDNTVTYKLMYDMALYDPVTLEVVNSKTFDDVLILYTDLPILLHDGRVMFINSHLIENCIMQQRIFDPEDMSITKQPDLYITHSSKVKEITMAHLIPFSPF